MMNVLIRAFEALATLCKGLLAMLVGLWHKWDDTNMAMQKMRLEADVEYLHGSISLLNNLIVDMNITDAELARLRKERHALETEAEVVRTRLRRLVAD